MTNNKGIADNKKTKYINQKCKKVHIILTYIVNVFFAIACSVFLTAHLIARSERLYAVCFVAFVVLNMFFLLLFVYKTFVAAKHVLVVSLVDAVLLLVIATVIQILFADAHATLKYVINAIAYSLTTLFVFFIAKRKERREGKLSN